LSKGRQRELGRHGEQAHASLRDEKKKRHGFKAMIRGKEDKDSGRLSGKLKRKEKITRP